MKKWIASYIPKLKKEHILKFSRENGIHLDEEELDYVYEEVKNNWEYYLYGNPDFLNVRKLKNGDKIEKLYYIYKEKYKNYL